MPPSKKRKIAPSSEPTDFTPKQQPAPEITTSQEMQASAVPNTSEDAEGSKIPELLDKLEDKTKQRQERFKALQARARKSAQRNITEAKAESQRLATNPELLSSLSRKQAFASHKLLQADTDAAGEDFERKRAWDWTVEDSEKWDKRMEKKEKHREDVAFQDYTQDARKMYKKQVREMQPDMEGYEKQKAAAVQRAAMTGGLEIVETDDGELVAVDKNGTFYSTADSTDFTENKPEKAAVDRLVKDLQKAEENRYRKRKERGRQDDDGDVTFINEKNKQFNQKLSRFYNKASAPLPVDSMVC